MVKRKTDEQFKKEVYSLVKDEYTFLEPYKTNLDKLLCIHNKCGHTYYIAPKFFLKGNRCKKCVSKENAKRNTKPRSYVEDKLKKVHGDEYSIVGDYKNVNTKVKVRHNICGDEYFIRPDSLLRGSKCKKCLHKRYAKDNTKTTQEFSREVRESTWGEYELVSEYVDTYTTVKIKHSECGEIFTMKPYKFVIGRRCTKCNQSKGEKLTSQALVEMGVNFEIQKTFDDLIDIKHLSYDFFIPEFNLLIEYQGIQHTQPISIFGGEEAYIKQQHHDKLKRDYATKKGYKLLEISYKNNKYNTIMTAIKDKLNDCRKAERF